MQIKYIYNEILISKSFHNFCKICSIVDISCPAVIHKTSDEVAGQHIRKMVRIVPRSERSTDLNL